MKSFDRNSGVVYTELTSARVGSMVPTWMSQARGKRDKKSTLRSRGTGCSSLRDMALRTCAWNAELFAPEALQWASWHYASEIYHHLLNTDTLTFNAWEVFADAYPTKIKARSQFHVYPPRELSSEPTLLPSIVNRLAKLDTSLVTLLCIRDFALTFDDFKELLKIPTLGALILEQSRRNGVSELHTRHFSDWCRAARDIKALQHLRVLMMCDFGIGRKAVLEGVSSFPALALVGLHNSRTWSMSDPFHSGYGDWQVLSVAGLEQRGLSHKDFNPQHIWGSSYHTTHSKVQQLYHLTRTFVEAAGLDEQRSVCIGYGGWTDRQSIHEAASWYVRYTLREPPKSEDEVIEQAEIPNRTAVANKRRKVRSGKQTDIGAMLGAFT